MPSCVFSLLVGLVAPLLLRQSFLLAQPVAVFRRLIPTDRQASGNPAPDSAASPLYIVVLAETYELLHRHRLRSDSERASDPLSVQLLVIGPMRLGGRRAHQKLHRAGNDHHRLALAGDVPLRLCFSLRQLLPNALEPLFPLLLVLRPLLLNLLEPLVLFPLDEAATLPLRADLDRVRCDTTPVVSPSANLVHPLQEPARRTRPDSRARPGEWTRQIPLPTASQSAPGSAPNGPSLWMIQLRTRGSGLCFKSGQTFGGMVHLQEGDRRIRLSLRQGFFRFLGGVGQRLLVSSPCNKGSPSSPRSLSFG